MIKVDISNVWGQLSLPDLLAVEQEVAAAHRTLTEGTGDGNDFLGWLDLPVENESEEMKRIQIAADKIAHRHTDGDRAMTVAEIPIVVHLKQRAHGMIPDGKGIDDRLGGLDLIS